MIELVTITLGIVAGGALIAWGLNARNEAGEIEQMRRFQQAMKDAGRTPPPHRED